MAMFDPLGFAAGSGFCRVMGRLRPGPVVNGMGVPVPSVAQSVVKWGSKQESSSSGPRGKISRRTMS